jgi:hypothetical protein
LVDTGIREALARLDPKTKSLFDARSMQVQESPEGVRVGLAFQGLPHSGLISPTGRRVTVWTPGGYAASANAGSDGAVLGLGSRLDWSGPGRVPSIVGRYIDAAGLFKGLRGVVFGDHRVLGSVEGIGGGPLGGGGGGVAVAKYSDEWWRLRILAEDPSLPAQVVENIICLFRCLMRTVPGGPVMVAICLDLLVVCFTSAGWLIASCLLAAACMIVGLILLIYCWGKCMS